MSQQLLEERVGTLEREQARQGAKLDHLSGVVGEVSSGVKTLLERDARRPQALSWGVIAATAGGLIGVAAVGWWLIETSPAVRELNGRIDKVNERVTRLDDPEIGRVPAVERKVHELDQWAPRVTRY